MNLAHLRYFLAVIETGSFTRGAERSNVTQPTLSAAIQRLEEWLEAPLFQRGRRVALTAAGARFAERARTILAEASAARAECRAEQPQQSLRLGWLKSLPFARLAALLAAFARSERDVTLDLVEAGAERLASQLERGRLDAAVTLLPDAPDRRRSAPLLREAYIIAAASEHPLARRVRCRIGELHGMAFVLRSDCEILPTTDRLFADHGVRPRVIHRTTSNERALALVRAGLGVTLIPESLLGDGLQSIAVGELNLQRRIGLCWRGGAGEAVERLRDLALSQSWSAQGTSASPLTIAH